MEIDSKVKIAMAAAILRTGGISWLPSKYSPRNELVGLPPFLTKVTPPLIRHFLRLHNNNDFNSKKFRRYDEVYSP